MTLEERIKGLTKIMEERNGGSITFRLDTLFPIIQELQTKNKELEAQQEAETIYYESKNINLTRLEVIDESGRVYVNNNCKMELSYQDEGSTLKIFVNN